MKQKWEKKNQHHKSIVLSANSRFVCLFHRNQKSRQTLTKSISAATVIQTSLHANRQIPQYKLVIDVIWILNN